MNYSSILYFAVTGLGNYANTFLKNPNKSFSSLYIASSFFIELFVMGKKSI